MKNEIIIKDGRWVWPKIDENSWNGQNESIDLYNHIVPHLRNKNVMVQAGGNCGFLLSTFVEHFTTIYTFEPDPVNFYCLTQNVTSQNVIKMQCCLGNEPSPVTVQQLIRPERLHDTGGVHVSGRGVIPSIKLDDLNLWACDLLQLDVEGFELNALGGSVNTISKYKPILCVEFCDKWLRRYGTSSDELYSLITEELNYSQVGSYKGDRIFSPNEL